MNKLTAYINGFNPSVLQNHTPDSKRKASVFATVIWLPVLLWACIGYLIPNVIFDMSLAASVFTGVVAGLAIFLIERSIIISNGGWIIGLFRVVLGLVVAVLGAVFIDIVIFSGDIDTIRQKQNAADAREFAENEEARIQEDISILKQEVKRIEDEHKENVKDLKDEMDGNGPSKKVGKDKIADAKEKIALNSKKRFEDKEAELTALKLKGELVFEEALASFVPANGFLTDYGYVMQLLNNNPDAKFLYWLFTALLVLLEFMVIIIKLTSKKSVLEAEVDYIQYSQIAKINRMKQEEFEYLRLPHNQRKALNHLKEMKQLPKTMLF